MSTLFAVLGCWFLVSCFVGACWSVYRGRQKEMMRRLEFEAYQLERARHYHIVTEYQRIGAI